MKINLNFFITSLLFFITLIIFLIVIKQYFYKDSVFLTTTKTNTKKIGILKTASHPALDAAEKSFIDEIQNNFDTEIICETKNAEGSIIAMNTITNYFLHDNDIVLFYAIGTPALQSMAQNEKSKPIVFSAVTDIASLKLDNQKNICGVLDAINVTTIIDTIKTGIPMIRSIGIIFNTAELNSVKTVADMKKECKKLNITIYEIGVLSATDIISSLEHVIGKIDLIFAPSDHLVASAAVTIAAFANQNKIPTIFSDNLLLKYGVLGAYGINYFDAGKRAGEIATLLLENKTSTSKIGIENLPISYMMINQSIYEKMKDKFIFDHKTMRFNN